jgi:hypothetical protein
MDAGDVIRDIEETGAVVFPSLVLLQLGTVKDVYGPKEWAAAAITARWLVDRHGSPVTIYQVDGRLPPPPPPGTRITTPHALGWMEIGSETVQDLPIAGSAVKPPPPPPFLR